MCGVAGIFEVALPPEEYSRVLQRMGDAMAHRGPDQAGSLVLAELGGGLVCRRLALVDLEGGRQPIANEDGTVHVVFNGEIYNHRELRQWLERHGHHFRTGCDTEVIVHLYEELGVEFVDRLQGMFALAIADTRRRRLVLARDGSGMKPLYWAETVRGLMFASEIKALLATGLVKAEADWSAVAAFMDAGFVPPPRTGFVGIHKLPPGARLVAEAGQVRSELFWRPRFEHQRPRRRAPDYAAELEHLLRESVRLHMAADVPVGSFLSGGWDSSLIASYAAPHASGRLKTFSIVFPDDPAADESRFSRRMAEHLGSDHREIEFRSSDIPALLPLAIRHSEEPQTRSPMLLRYQLAKLASAEVKATVSGEGSDELFGGYAWFRSRDFTLGEMLRGVTPPALARGFAQLPFGRAWQEMARALNAEDQTAVDLAWMARLHRADPQWLQPDLARTAWNPTELLPDAQTRASCRDRLQRRLCFEFHGRLRDGIMLETDKLNMAHSLESRIPFLHRPVIDFAHSLPSDLKRRWGREKYLLRWLVRELPPEIAQRRKQGLGYARDFTSHPSVFAYSRDLLLDSESPAPFLADRRFLETTLAASSLPQARRPNGLWSALTLQCWWNEFFAQPASVMASSHTR